MKPTSFVINVDAKGLAPSSEFSTLPLRGVYVILHGQNVIRIGECSSGVARLKKGFRDPLRRTLRGKDRKNYIAYSWRDNYRGKPVNIDYFDLTDSRFQDTYLRRALEAEITFQFRIARKSWPIEMSEIHFLERYRADSLLVQTASAILSHYGIAYNAAI